jgi:hypothetical protein
LNLINKIKSLIKKECANYNYDGDFCFPADYKCRFFDNGITLKRCKYFEKSVLPINASLECEYRKENNMMLPNENLKRCRCGQFFYPTSNRQKYCDDCKKEIQKQQSLLRKQKQRGTVTR